VDSEAASVIACPSGTRVCRRADRRRANRKERAATEAAAARKDNNED